MRAAPGGPLRPRSIQSANDSIESPCHPPVRLREYSYLPCEPTAAQLRPPAGEPALPASRQAEALPCHHGLRRQTIVQSLLTDIVQGRLRAGEHLITQELAQRFGVSHTPIREALIALAGIGIIDLLPNRGAVVRPVSREDVREVCHVRRILECAATRAACGRIELAR